MGIRILVTGATGSVGRELLRALAGHDVTVIGGTTTLAKAAGLERQGVEPAVVDFSDCSSLAAAMRGVKRIFLSMPLAEAMAAWAANVLAVARAAGIHHIVRSSAMGADVNVAFRLGRAHGMVDQLIAESEIPYTILRPSSLMQDYVSSYGQGIRERGTIALPRGDGRVSLVDGRDVARSAALVLTSPGPHWNRSYDLTGPEALSNEDIARTISRVIGRAIGYTSPDDDDVRREMLEAGTAEWDVEAVMSLHRHVRAGKAAAVTGHVEEITGAKPTSFAQFALEHADSW